MPRCPAIALTALVAVSLPALRPPAPAPALAAGVPAAAAAGPSGPTHRVQPGESLWLLARRYGTTVAALAAANGIANPDLILVDQVLVVPAAPTPGRAPEGDAAAAAPGGDAAADAPPKAEAIPVRVLGLPRRPPGPDLPLHLVSRLARAEAMALPAAPAPSTVPVDAPDLPPSPGLPLIRVPAAGQVVALTFNGLPEPARVEELLDALAAAGARATFFVSGAEAAAAPALVRRLVAAGHELGTLGQRGEELDGLTRLAAEAELIQAARALGRAGAPAPRFFRPPGGLYSPELLAGAADAGLTPVLWSAIGLRDRPGTPPALLAEQAARAAVPGAVLMLHAGRPGTVGALPRVLAALAAAGYRATSVGDVLQGG